MQKLYRGILHNCILLNANDLENSYFKNDDEIIIYYDEEEERIIIENIKEKSKQWVKKYGDILCDDYNYEVDYIDNIVVVAFCDDSGYIKIEHSKIENQSKEEKEKGLAICMAKYLRKEIPPYIKQLE